MAFDGDLDSLPITDLIQLLHATGKSGTLTLRGPKGDSQLVFDGGYIVSANHVNNSMRIGRILVDMGALTREALDAALFRQAAAGTERAPLLASLLESGAIQPAQAYKGLEILIELTIVEILTWSRGSFSLDLTKTFVCDEYRYFPEKLKQQIHLNTQSVLMDALRIYDERKRDGTLMDAEFFGGEAAVPEETVPEVMVQETVQETTVPEATVQEAAVQEAAVQEAAVQEAAVQEAAVQEAAVQEAAVQEAAQLSAEDLGLDALDELEESVPERFSAFTDPGESGSVRHRLKEALAGVPPQAAEELILFLEGMGHPAAPPAVFLLASDPLTRELVNAACGAQPCAVGTEAELFLALEGAEQARAGIVLLAAGPLGPVREDNLVPLLARLRARCPELDPFILVQGENQHQLFASALHEGVAGVVPWPRQDGEKGRLVPDARASAKALRRLVERKSRTPRPLPPSFLECYRELCGLAAPPEVTLALLRFVACFFPRALTLVQLRGELVAEKGIGFGAPGAVAAHKLRLSLEEGSLLKEVVELGEPVHRAADPFVAASFAPLGAPAAPEVLLLPVKSMGRVIALIYGDWGGAPAGDPPLALLEVMARHAGLVLDNGLYRRRAGQAGE